MQKRKGISLMDAVIILVVVVLGFFIFLPALSTPHRPRLRIVCATNLKGMGLAMMTYGLDYDDKYPVIGGKDAPWSKTLGWSYDYSSANYLPGGAQEKSPRTITASLYLLVREADVHPASFICKESSQTRFENTSGKDLTELWDFGPDPYKHVSYAMQNPFGKFPATGAGNPSNLIAADMSPWFKDGNIVPPSSRNEPPKLIHPIDSSSFFFGNSLNHEGQGQNVLFGDGHTEFVRTSNVGVDDDNIYTYWSKDAAPTDYDKQIGKNPVARDKDNDSKSDTDSFLAI